MLADFQIQNAKDTCQITGLLVAAPVLVYSV
jgi:hypothetical protein